MAFSVEFKKVNREAVTPRYAHEGDAGCDLQSVEDLVLEPGARAMVPTGIAVSIPVGYAGFVQPRSGLAARHGVSIVNTPGLIDSHYRGEIKVILVNLDPERPFEVKRYTPPPQAAPKKQGTAAWAVPVRLREPLKEAYSSGASLASIQLNILRSCLPTTSTGWFLSAS